MLLNKWRVIIGIVTLAFLIILASFAIFIQQFLTTAIIPQNRPLDYILKPGASVRVVANDLNKLGLLKYPNLLVTYAHFRGATKNLKAGEYLFAPGTTPKEIIEMMVAGNVLYHRFTLIEGWTFHQLINGLAQEPHLVHTLSGLSTPQILNKIGIPNRNPEGLFFPATYYFTAGTTDTYLLKKAYQTMMQQLAEAWQLRSPGLPYQNSYQALIAASLIEKETADSAEKPLISGIIIRRLNIGMPLQIDSAVAYGVRNILDGGKLTGADLRIKTPYNTYLNKGLPPTPIAMPSGQSIQATLHPANSNYLFFVSKGNGTHQFSETYTQQKQAVEKYEVNVHMPKIGKRDNNFNCQQPWYVSTNVKSLLKNRCQLN